MKSGPRVTLRLATVAAVLVLATSLLGTGCNKARGGQRKKNLVVPVQVEPATSERLVNRVYLSGEVQADVEVRVFSLVPERITKLNFEEGQVVKEGEILAVIKGGVLWQTVQQAQAGLKGARTQKDLAKIELERTQALYQSRTVAIAALQRAQAQYNVADAQVRQMEATVGQTYQNIANVVVRAPITGIVGQRFLSAGDLAGPGIPLCTVIQIDSVRVKAMATEFDLVQLKPKQPVEVTVPALPGRTFSGHVDFLSPVIDRATRSAWVTVFVKNPDQALRPGMFADMKVTVGEKSNVVMTQSRAVTRWVTEQGKVTHSLYVIQDDRAVARTVVIGRREGDRMEIVSGLRPGEPVAVLGNHKLRQGTKVQVVKPRVNGNGNGGAPPTADASSVAP